MQRVGALRDWLGKGMLPAQLPVPVAAAQAQPAPAGGAAAGAVARGTCAANRDGAVRVVGRHEPPSAYGCNAARASMSEFCAVRVSHPHAQLPKRKRHGLCTCYCCVLQQAAAHRC